MNPELTSLLVEAGLQVGLYTVLLWILARVQKLNSRILGLLLTAVVGTAVTYIPGVGPYLSFVAVLICLRIFTGEDLSDLIFTAVIAGALMFAANLWLLGWVMPDLRSTVRTPVLPAEEVIPVRVLEFAEQPSGAVVLSGRGDNPRSGPPSVVLKGLTMAEREQYILIGIGDRSTPLKAGEHTVAGEGENAVEVTCEAVQRDRVLIQIRQQGKKERVELRFRPPPPAGPIDGSPGTNPAAPPTP